MLSPLDYNGHMCLEVSIPHHSLTPPYQETERREINLDDEWKSYKKPTIYASYTYIYSHIKELPCTVDNDPLRCHTLPKQKIRVMDTFFGDVRSFQKS